MTAQIKKPTKKPITKHKPLTKLERSIAAKRAEGKSTPQIAKETGTSQSTVYRKLQHNEIENLVKNIGSRVVSEGASDAADNQIYKVKLSKAILNNDKTVTLPANIDPEKLLDIGDKTETRILEAIGIYHARTQSIVYNTLVNQSNNLIGSDILQILQRLNIKQIGHDDPRVIDATLLDQLDVIVEQE